MSASARPILGSDDISLPFQVDTLDLRGRVVRLGPVIDRMLARHAYPEPVAAIVGELVVATALLAGTLKFEGIMTAQIKSDGPIRLIVVDFKTPGHMRAYARFDDIEVVNACSVAERYGNPVQCFLGRGNLAFTVDQGPDTERYQGMVELTGKTVADCIHHYLKQSEQHNALMRIAVEAPQEGRAAHAWRAGGLMVQHMPGLFAGRLQDEGIKAERLDLWHRAEALAASTRPEELVDPELGPDALLWRLFHLDGVRVFDPIPLENKCRCSRERILGVMSSFPADELETMLVDGKIEVTCEFCNQKYDFTLAQFAEAAAHD
ncbi:MAG: Hsp33 family molecular chaperone [Proteobacteria bacterium]|nr:Hsp33 family molecular chaperone [Pseudomonadota bacterium]